MDAVYKAQTSRKLRAKRFCTFEIVKLIGKNGVRLQLPKNIRTHDVVQVEHTKILKTQSTDIVFSRPASFELHINEQSEQIIEVG